MSATESLRPRIHYTPVRHWINDPNGLVYSGGRYHLFYQHNPHANHHGHMSWGHAVSPDLVHWQEREVALPEREHQIFSGSAVLDTHNSSGLGLPGEPVLVACYTGHIHGNEAQYLAFSQDGGEHWKFAEGGSVLDEQKPDFRDPKVFWHAPTARWVMALVYPDQRQIGLYAAANLRDWTPLSTFGPAGFTDGIWEVPELFPLQDEQRRTHWVMKVDLNPGGPYGGSGAQYWLGDFDGVQFTPRTPARWLDHGQDFYAAITFDNVPDRRVWLAWMGNWQYAHDVPTHPWRGAMTLPRELGVQFTPDGPVLTQRPIRELEGLRQEEVQLKPGESSLQPGEAHELILSGLEAGSGLQLTFNSKVGPEVTVEVSGGELAVTRPEPAAPLDGFAGRHTARLAGGAELGDLRIFLDSSSIELFAAGGQLCITDLLLPSQPIERVWVSGEFKSGQLWRLAGCIREAK